MIETNEPSGTHTINPQEDNSHLLPDPLEFAAQDDVIIELGDDFDFGGFQVVRREFFAHIHEPSVTFNKCKFYANTACLVKFPQTEYIQVLINQDSKMLLIRPCAEGTRDAFPWCLNSKGRRKPRAITCKILFAKVVSLMGWNPDHRYKLLGRMIHANNMYLLAFDLTATEVYQRTSEDGEKPKTSRTPVFPADWQDQFGVPFVEHSQSMQINIFDGYAVYAIKDNGAAPSNDASVLDDQAVPSEPVTGGGGNEYG